MEDSVPSLNSVTRETNKLLEVRAVVCDDDLGLNGFGFDNHIIQSFEAVARDFNGQTHSRDTLNEYLINLVFSVRYLEVPILVSLLLINDPRALRVRVINRRENNSVNRRR